MITCNHYRLGFDIWALVLFLAVMMPTIIWAFVPARPACKLNPDLSV